MKMLKINRCPDSMMWYSRYIGCYVPYLGSWPESYKSQQQDGYINMVKFEDATIVDNGDNIPLYCIVNDLIEPNIADDYQPQYLSKLPDEKSVEAKFNTFISTIPLVRLSDIEKEMFEYNIDLYIDMSLENISLMVNADIVNYNFYGKTYEIFKAGFNAASMQPMTWKDLKENFE